MGKKKLFYSPRGLLLDYENEEELSFFVTNLKEFIKEHNGILLKIDPMIVYQNHDKEGNVVGDFKNNKVVDNLIKNKLFIMVLVRVIVMKYNIDGHIA